VAHGTHWVGLDAARVAALAVLDSQEAAGGTGPLPVVMGLDQQRAQITAEWTDLATGEISRGRVAPADRAAVRRLLSRFAGRELEVALEATTGWRFVVEELERVGAGVHLAEPAETSGLRGPKRRPKTDRADARHLRELLLIGRLAESWIAPGHILDLRARVRCRHTLSHRRTECQQRIQSVLYHHGCPHKRDLMTAEGRDWLAAQRLPLTAREQVTVALTMIDAFDIQLAPLTARLRDYARRQTGCKALIAAHYGIGAPISVTILAELGDARRFDNSRDAVRYAGWTSRSSSQTSAVRPDGSGAAGAALGAVRGRAAGTPSAQPRPRLLPATGRADRRQPRLPRARAQTAQALLPHASRPRRRRPGAGVRTRRARQALDQTDASRPAGACQAR
jgi:transposase